MEILKYTLVNRVYQNGYYDLWEAENDLGLKAIAKVSKNSFANHPGIRQAFREEALSLARITHPYIIKAIGFDETDGISAFLTEQHNAVGIKSFISKKGKLSEENAIAIISKLMDGIQSIFTAKSPIFKLEFENIYISENLKPIITGLGYQPEVVLGFGGHYSDDQDERIVFQSPETLTGQTENPVKSAIYGCGIVFYYLLKGKLPIETKNRPIQEVYLDIVTHNWLPVYGITALAKTWLDSLSETDPSKRYKSIADALEGLNLIKESLDKNKETQCKNKDCGNLLKANAKFCGKCGSQQI